MSISLLLDMAVSAHPDRLAIVDGDRHVTTSQLDRLCGGGATVLADSGARHIAYIGLGGVHLSHLIFSAARAAIPFTPLNYRLSSASLHDLISGLSDALVIVDKRYEGLVDEVPTITAEQFLEQSAAAPVTSQFADPDGAAIALFTSGTTSRPKAVELSHNNLLSYVTTAVDFDSAAVSDATLVCVPPYHVAGVGAALSNLYAGRKVVYLKSFEPKSWISLINAHKVTTATVVPTMLSRIVNELEVNPAQLPTLKNLAYGGSKVALPLIRRVIEMLPDVGLVNAYGLTETSSTIAVLGPEDHRSAYATTDPKVARRLRSVGKAAPGVELQIRDEAGGVLPAGRTGELFVRGAQVSGRYTGIGSVLDDDGWFPTRDVAMLDIDGYLFIGGRSDDTIIRGGENISPVEIEDVLHEHVDVREVAVVGVEDPHWGQIIVAVVVPEPGSQPHSDALRDWVRASLRGSRTPDRIVFREELPFNATGKVLRRQLVQELESADTKELA